MSIVNDILIQQEIELKLALENSIKEHNKTSIELQEALEQLKLEKAKVELLKTTLEELNKHNTGTPRSIIGKETIYTSPHMTVTEYELSEEAKKELEVFATIYDLGEVK